MLISYAQYTFSHGTPDLDVISTYITNELGLGRIHGPFNAPVAHQAHTSPIGVIPKRNRPGKWRLICDLSSPKNHSVNDGISPASCSLKYTTVQDVVSEIQRLGRGSLLAKIYIKEAYRILPVHPQDRPLLGFLWQGNVYVDGTLPFGLCSAPKIFNIIADLLNWILIDQCHTCIIHYLDDFLIIGPQLSPLC